MDHVSKPPTPLVMNKKCFLKNHENVSLMGLFLKHFIITNNDKAKVITLYDVKSTFNI